MSSTCQRLNSAQGNTARLLRPLERLTSWLTVATAKNCSMPSLRFSCVAGTGCNPSASTKPRAFKHHAPIRQNRCYRFSPSFPGLGIHSLDNLKGLNHADLSTQSAHLSPSNHKSQSDDFPCLGHR